jgi:hemolysin III
LTVLRRKGNMACMQQSFLDQRRYDRAELVADGIVHGFAIVAALIGVILLAAKVAEHGVAHAAAYGLYAAALFAMLGFSMAYNLMPASPLKWLLRRFDHSAIYLLIAGTYTPLLVQLPDKSQAALLAAAIWAGAAIGIALKVLRPGRHDGLAIVAYLALGWIGIFAAPAFVAVLPAATVFLIAAGGIFYSAGVPFYLWERLRFQNAIWHGFVTAAAACHFVGIGLLYT